MPTFPKRRRATAIVEHPEGILVTLMRYMACGLPGGGVQPGESDEAAVIRELREETGLVAINTIFLFRYESIARSHAVYWVQADGDPAPCGEVDQVGYYCKGSPLKLAPEARAIIERYYVLKAAVPALA